MTRFLLLAVLGVMAVGVAQAQTTPSVTHVIVMSLDGARPDAILDVPTPNIDALAERGAATWTARTTFPPVTVPAHASLLTGLDVSEHGVVWNDYSTEAYTDADTFITVAHDNGYKAALVAGKNKLDQFQQREETPFVFATAGDASVVDAVLPLLDDGYEVLFVHFPNPDYFGHSSGWMTERYLYELSNTDRQIGRLIDGVAERGWLDTTLIIVTADHGGLGIVHGRDIPEDMLIPWVVAGPGVREGVLLDGDVFVGDTAATVLCALGLTVPESERARPVVAAFIEPPCDV